MSLNDIVGRAIELCDLHGAIDTHQAVQTAIPLVMADEEAADQLIREALTKRIKDAATKMTRRADLDRRQESFFGNQLRTRYALDLDGRIIKDTEFLSRIEFNRVISIREKQIKDDAAALAVLIRARDALSPIWDMHPEYTYGEAERAFLAAEQVA